MIYLLLAFTACKPEVASHLQQSSVTITTKTGQGSGFIVHHGGKAYVMTCAHVVADAKEPILMQSVHASGQEVARHLTRCRIIRCDTTADLAVLEVLGPPIGESILCGKPAAVGSEIVHVGSMAGLYGSLTCGIVSALDRDFNGQVLDQMDALAAPGSSGGGVYSLDGRLVGMYSAYWVSLPGAGFFIPLERIIAWTRDNDVPWLIQY